VLWRGVWRWRGVTADKRAREWNVQDWLLLTVMMVRRRKAVVVLRTTAAE
jgi:hypothetical protein